MARQRDFAATAKRGAVDRGDNRLVARVHHVDDFVQRCARRRLAEFGDVGAGEERLAIAADHHCLDRRIVDALADARVKAVTHPRAQRVHRGRIGDDDENVVVAFEADGGSHFGSSPIKFVSSEVETRIAWRSSLDFDRDERNRFRSSPNRSAS